MIKIHLDTDLGGDIDDLINFQHDPLACVIALGWNEGVEIEEIPLVLEVKDGWLVERIDERGKATQVVTKVDGVLANIGWTGCWRVEEFPGASDWQGGSPVAARTGPR